MHPNVSTRSLYRLSELSKNGNRRAANGVRHAPMVCLARVEDSRPGDRVSTGAAAAAGACTAPETSPGAGANGVVHAHLPMTGVTDGASGGAGPGTVQEADEPRVNCPRMG